MMGIPADLCWRVRGDYRNPLLLTWKSKALEYADKGDTYVKYFTYELLLGQCIASDDCVTRNDSFGSCFAPWPP